MKWISNELIQELINYKDLIHALDLAFREQRIVSPPKTMNTYTSVDGGLENTFIYMPAWDNEKYFGCKLITSTPNNSQRNDPYVNGIYNLFDATNGKPLLSMDAKLITNLRTAATSALAASKLIRSDSRTLMILGNGAISPFYIEAHQVAHQYEKIYLWGRNINKSKEVIDNISNNINAEIIPVERYKDKLNKVDVISCITSSNESLINQSDLGEGQHLDLAGSFTHDMHEVSTDVISNSSVYTDNLDTTPYHAGEIVTAVKEGAFKLEDIKGDLTQLCQTKHTSRSKVYETTLFKSTGMALEDLVIAGMLVERM
jgi:ornithine cyclodeaminase